MLVRFVVENVFSFGERKEFNSLPNKRLKTLNHHKYSFDGFEILKLSSIYGANGAGKSNLIKSLFLFQKLVLNKKVPFRSGNTQFKFNPGSEDKPQVFVIEFIQGNTAFYYGIELLNHLVIKEELYLSGLGKEEDRLIYERKTDKDETTTITFLDDFEKDEKSQLLKSILLEEFVKPNKPILELISKRDNKYLQDVKKAFKWFKETLQIVTPESRPYAMAQRMDIDSEFKKFAENIMDSLHIGITSFTIAKNEVEEFFGKDNKEFLDEIKRRVEISSRKMIPLRNGTANEVVVVEEDGKLLTKQLMIEHTGKNSKSVLFDLEEESDGTIRLLDYIPGFQNIITKNKVLIIDEIERSIHPLLIKELVSKFSLDPETKGQLIFTTHESNLLDQEIFRQDEIWFAEKDKSGSTDLYSLSAFKEHKTIDIRKGYLNGRYGSIPFLANLQDLNWHTDDTNQ